MRTIEATNILTGETWLVEWKPYVCVPNGKEPTAEERKVHHSTFEAAVRAAIAQMEAFDEYYLLPRASGAVLVGPLRENSIYPEDVAHALWDEWIAYWTAEGHEFETDMSFYYKQGTDDE